MKKYAPVGPLPMYGAMLTWDECLGFHSDNDDDKWSTTLLDDYFFINAYDIVRQCEFFSELFDDDEPGRTVILDCNPHVAYVFVFEAMKRANTNVVCLPYKKNDGRATIDKIKRFLDYAAGQNEDVFCIAAPQGKDEKEVKECTEEIAQLHSPSLWGLTDNIVERPKMVDWLFTQTDTSTHMIGLSNNLQEDFVAVRKDAVAGISCSVPIVLAVQRIPFERETYRQIEWEDFNRYDDDFGLFAKTSRWIANNILMMRREINQ